MLNLDKIFPCLMTPRRSNARSSLYGVYNNGPYYYWTEYSPSLFDFMIEAINLGLPGFTSHVSITVKCHDLNMNMCMGTQPNMIGKFVHDQLG